MLDIAPAFQAPRIQVECCRDERIVNAHRVNPAKFLTELRRRNVYRAAVAYGVVAWFLTQLTTQVFPFFEIPNSAVRFVIIALVVGFPIAMLLSWVYEFTPEGIVRTDDLDPVQAISVERATGRILDFIIIGVLLLAIAMLIVGRRPFYRQPGESISQKSIAVLPFENLSRDPDNAYFATGIQDEILTRIAKIGALKVISRVSTRQYSARPDNLSEIAHQLGVTNILEGSVQRAADQVHVNVQLISAATDEHLWAESYDRKLENIFGVEAEVATAVAEALEAKLTGAEQHALEQKPTNNPEAYDAYLRGIALYGEANTLGELSKSTQPFEEAVRLDPNFAMAWAMLVRLNSLWYFWFEAKPSLRAAAQKSLETALRLRPDLPEVQLAQAFYQYFVLGDLEGARRNFERLLTKLPNDDDIPFTLVIIALRQGRLDESRAYADKAIELNPRDRDLRHDAAWVRKATRDFAGALRCYDEALSIWPDDPQLIAGKASVYQSLGELDQADALLQKLHPTAKNALPASLKFTIKPNYADGIQILLSCYEACWLRPVHYRFPRAFIVYFFAILNDCRAMSPARKPATHKLATNLSKR